MTTELIKRIETFIEQKRLINQEEYELRRLAAKAVQERGWDVKDSGTDRKGYYLSFEKMLDLLQGSPEDDWKKTLRIDFDPIEVRKIDGSFYSPNDIKAGEDFYKAGIHQGTVFALVKEKTKGGDLTVKDFSFNGAFVCFAPKAEKVTVTTRGWYAWEVRIKDRKQALLDAFNKEVDKLNEKILKEAVLYITSTDEYERFIAKTLYKSV